MRYAALGLILLATSAHPVSPNRLGGHALVANDVDSDGVIDLIRVSADTVTVSDVNKVNQYSFAVQEQFAVYAERFPSEPMEGANVSAKVLQDLNGNGSPEILITAGANWSGERSYTSFSEVWDPLARVRLELNFGRDDCDTVWDQTGDGVPEAACPTRWGRVPVYDPVDNMQLASLDFSWWLFTVQVLPGPRGVGILGEGLYNYGADRRMPDAIEFRSPDTGEITQSIWLGPGEQGELHGAVYIPDLNGNESREWAIMRTDGTGNDRRTSVVVHDSRTGARLRTIEYTGRYADPVTMFPVNGTDLAMVSEYPSGVKFLEVADSRTGERRLKAFFPQHMRLDSVARVPDINGNGTHEVAVMGMWEHGDHSIWIRDSRTGVYVRKIWIPN